MSIDPNSPSGTPADTSGAPVEPKPDDKVAYETYRKVLSEKKKRDEENEQLAKQLKDLQAEKKAKIEEELKQKEDYKKLLELRDAENKELAVKLKQTEDERAMALKLRSFLDEVNGSVGQEYFGLIDLEQVVIDPTTGRADPASVQKAAREFEKTYGKVIAPKSGKSPLPNQSAQAVAGGKITVAEWKALKTSKEMKEKYSQVDWST